MFNDSLAVLFLPGRLTEKIATFTPRIFPSMRLLTA
jgi:hypothetical protein